MRMICTSYFDLIHFTESTWASLQIGESEVVIEFDSGLLLLEGHPARHIFGAHCPPCRLIFRKVESIVCTKHFYKAPDFKQLDGTTDLVECKWPASNHPLIKFYAEGFLRQENCWCDASIVAESSEMVIDEAMSSQVQSAE